MRDGDRERRAVSGLGLTSASGTPAAPAVCSPQCPPELSEAGAEAPEGVTEVSDKQLRKLHARLKDTLHVRDRCRTCVPAVQCRALGSGSVTAA